MSFTSNENQTVDATVTACEQLEDELTGFVFEFGAGRNGEAGIDAVLVGYTPDSMTHIVRVLPLADVADAADNGDGIDAALREAYTEARQAWQDR